MSEAMFHFDRYFVRPVEERDRAYIDKLIADDPYHRDCMDVNFFLQLAPGEDAWAVEDRYGEVMLYFKTSTAVRLAIQFGNQDRQVNREVLQKGLAWLETMLVQNRFREVIFDTESPVLAATAKRRLGFADAPAGTLHKALGRPEVADAAKGHWHHRPRAFQKAG